jgi:Rrf2 family nitric oxide-sensitive transcriptional repressor
MTLSHRTDYALRTLMFLAGNSDGDGPERIPSSRIAQSLDISMNHLVKIVHELARLGYVQTTRGPGGGVQLARPAEEIVIGQVIEDFEGKMHLHDCVTTRGICVIESNCKLKGIFRQADELQRSFLQRFTLADVLLPRTESVRT